MTDEELAGWEVFSLVVALVCLSIAFGPAAGFGLCALVWYHKAAV